MVQDCGYFYLSEKRQRGDVLAASRNVEKEFIQPNTVHTEDTVDPWMKSREQNFNSKWWELSNDGMDSRVKPVSVRGSNWICYVIECDLIIVADLYYKAIGYISVLCR
jgi:hypothetical protein